MMQPLMAAPPTEMQEQVGRSMMQVVRASLPPEALALLDDQDKNTFQRLGSLREQLEKQEQTQQTPIDIHHYHCDHLGTPVALTDNQGQINYQQIIKQPLEIERTRATGGIAHLTNMIIFIKIIKMNVAMLIPWVPVSPI